MVPLVMNLVVILMMERASLHSFYYLKSTFFKFPFDLWLNDFTL
jgi:hypothetical protein